MSENVAIQRGFIFGGYTLNEQQTAQVRDILEVADACPLKIGHASIGTQAAREYKPVDALLGGVHLFPGPPQKAVQDEEHFEERVQR